MPKTSQTCRESRGPIYFRIKLRVTELLDASVQLQFALRHYKIVLLRIDSIHNFVVDFLSRLSAAVGTIGAGYVAAYTNHT